MKVLLFYQITYLCLRSTSKMTLKHKDKSSIKFTTLQLDMTNLFITGTCNHENTRDHENSCDQVTLTSHVTVGMHVTYHVTSGPLGYHVTYHITHHVIQLAQARHVIYHLTQT